MAAAVSKMLNYIGLGESAREELEEEYQDLGYEEAPELEHTPLLAVEEEEEEAPAPDLSRIVTVHPRTFADAEVIGRNFREGVPVILNLSEMSEKEARRMVDFAAGLIFGLYGAIEKVTDRVFLISPAAVKIDGNQRSHLTSPFHA